MIFLLIEMVHVPWTTDMENVINEGMLPWSLSQNKQWNSLYLPTFRNTFVKSSTLK